MNRYNSCLSLAAIGLAAVAGVTAQAQELPNKKPAKPSVSNMKSMHASKSGSSSVALQVASEPAAVDAITADALSGLFAEAGDAHFHHGEYNHVINLNQVVMEGDPSNMETYANNAFLLWSTDRKELGLATLKKGLAANSNDYYMYDELGNYYRIDLKDYSSALPYFEKATKFKCPYMTWHALALCYEKAGQWGKAVDAWASACRYPKDKLAPVRLKRAQEQLDKLKGSGK